MKTFLLVCIMFRAEKQEPENKTPTLDFSNFLSDLDPTMQNSSKHLCFQGFLIFDSAMLYEGLKLLFSIQGPTLHSVLQCYNGSLACLLPPQKNWKRNLCTQCKRATEAGSETCFLGGWAKIIAVQDP